jgi:hypothetical protein
MMTLWEFGLVRSDDISSCLAVVDKYAIKRSSEAIDTASAAAAANRAK